MSRPRAARIASLRAAAAPPFVARSSSRMRGSRGGERPGEVARAVGRGVVDEDELPVGEALRPDRGDGGGERRRGVPDRGDDREERRRRAGISSPGSTRGSSARRRRGRRRCAGRRRGRRAWCSCRPAPQVRHVERPGDEADLLLGAGSRAAPSACSAQLGPAVAAAGLGVEVGRHHRVGSGEVAELLAPTGRASGCACRERGARRSRAARAGRRAAARRRRTASTARPGTSSTFSRPGPAQHVDRRLHRLLPGPPLGRGPGVHRRLVEDLEQDAAVVGERGAELAPGAPGRRRRQAARVGARRRPAIASRR